jgi:hypothetical protein
MDCLVLVTEPIPTMTSSNNTRHVVEVTTKRQNSVFLVQDKTSKQRVGNESTFVKTSRVFFLHMTDLLFSCDRNNLQQNFFDDDE